MNTAAYYAQALHELGEDNPQKAREYIKNLRLSLALRGHEKLLPRILSELQKLDTQKQRTAKHRAVTPQMGRTDKLLQLYRKLIAMK